MKKVAIVGIVGLPAKYGGFETLVHYITLLKQNPLIKYTVYCTSSKFKKSSHFNNAVLQYIPLKANGIQSIFYDIWAILKSIRYDIILILGVSGCLILPIVRLLSNAKLIVNIDGIEHKRKKWGRFASFFLKLSESFAIKFAHQIIADNKAVADYVMTTYKKKSIIIPYGGDHSYRRELTQEVKDKYKLPNKYAFKVCRIEPENNIELILEAFSEIKDLSLVIIGNWNNSKYGIQIRNRFSKFNNIHLLDPIYDQNILDQIRSNCYVYIHGHSAGGTNPSLVEAMYLCLPVITYDVNFNRQTTQNKALYFSNYLSLRYLLQTIHINKLNELKNNMFNIAKENYCWNNIVEQYEKLYQ